MPLSNYPGGFPGGLTVRGLPVQQSHPGKVFWVGNASNSVTAYTTEGGVTGSDGNPGTYQKPFATIDYAIGKCTAGRGDIVLVMPGHAESISTTTFALAGISQDVDNVAVIGLGTAGSRPTITLDTDVDATWSVTGDYCTISNLIFTGNFLSVKSAITNSGGAGMTVENCLFQDTTAIKGLLAAVTTTVTVNADDLWVAGNTRYSIATTTPGTLVVIVGTIAGLTIKDNFCVHGVVENNKAILLEHGALVVTKLLMENNTCYSINTAQTTQGFLVTTSATTGSGIIRHNLVRSQDPSAAIMITPAAVQYGAFENYHTGETTQLSGIILPAVATDSS